MSGRSRSRIRKIGTLRPCANKSRVTPSVQHLHGASMHYASTRSVCTGWLRSITRGLIPCRTSSAASASPVGPAPTINNSTLVFRVRVRSSRERFAPIDQGHPRQISLEGFISPIFSSPLTVTSLKAGRGSRMAGKPEGITKQLATRSNALSDQRNRPSVAHGFLIQRRERRFRKSLYLASGTRLHYRNARTARSRSRRARQTKNQRQNIAALDPMANPLPELHPAEPEKQKGQIPQRFGVRLPRRFPGLSRVPPSKR